MSKKREKIDLNPVQTGLNAAFTRLDLPNLPPAPEAAKSEPKPAPQRKMGRVVLRKEKAGRGGKSVIVIADFAAHIHAIEIENLAKRLRAACGCGGTVREREIEIQGDQAGRIRQLLEAEGFQVAGIS